MRTLLKVIAVVFGIVLGLMLLISAWVYFFFDANQYKGDIEQAVRDATGREFAIEGDLNVSVFPWLALDAGRTTLGNAEGFGDDPFFQIESASFSVKILPLFLSDQLSIGTASLKGLRVNLAIDETGRTNWDDLQERSEYRDQMQEDLEIEVPVDDDGGSVTIEQSLEVDVAKVEIVDAAFSYRDAQEGTTLILENVNLQSGRISGDEPIPIDGGFRFAIRPDELSGEINMSTVASLDFDSGVFGLDDLEFAARIEGATEAPADIRFAAPSLSINTTAETMAPGSIEFSVFDLELTADVSPFSYAGSVEPEATLSIGAFSPRALLTTLGAELPETADPAALSLLMLDAKAAMTDDRISLSDIALVIDDTTFRGQLIVPRASDGSYELDLAGDTIDLNRYMAPADAAEAEAAASEETVPVEIPADLLRPINARGSLTIDEALMGKILFEDVELVLNHKDGRMRLHPISSKLFGGEYQGDVRLDVSGDTPVLSVDERIQNVSLAPLGKAMVDTEKLSGQINGQFVLTGTGDDTAEMQRTLNGNLSFELKDGAWEGTDVWHELRRARALIRQQPAPEPTLPARTRFSDVSATGTVTNGVLNNNDFRAELPFMQLNGGGTVNLVEATVDYSLNGRVFEKPELMGDITQEELDDFTKVELPIKITGSLADPKFGLDLEALARERVEDEVKGRLLDLLGGDEAEGENATEDEEPKDAEDVLKDRLRDLLKKD